LVGGVSPTSGVPPTAPPPRRTGLSEALQGSPGRIAHRLSHDDLLIIRQAHGFMQGRPVDEGPHSGGQPLRCTEQVDVLTDVAGIDGRIEVLLLL